ncbi:hypothetical protein GM556_07560 [Bombella sp. ESL0378]|uniref:hypothetical protein n=1 Tax=Bombella sp. ESL0378 TaxID=2676442 RepID=UPI0012D86F37|nr:hypothetical protein [Bombella sp. ESL0378]MUG05390.1 hypothetical protein [Bombella sp. ESL0378]
MRATLLQRHILRGLMMLIMLVAFSGQLLLTATSLPEESPRAAILRLTHLDIAPAPPPEPHAGPTMHDAMGMTTPHHTAQHDKMTHHGGHHHGVDCPLCPLLGHILFTLTSLFVLLSCIRLSRQLWQASPPAQAPPEPTRQRPPSRGPPRLFLNQTFA